MALLRRALVALGLAALVAAVLRLRGSGGTPPQDGGWRELSGPGPAVTSALMRPSSSAPAPSGARAARQLVESPDVDEVAVVDTDPARQAAIVEQLGRQGRSPGRADADADAVLLAGPCGTHAALARRARGGRSAAWCPRATRSTTCGRCSPSTPRPQARGVAVVAGAGFSPGYSCVLARHAAAELRPRHRGPRRPQRHRRPGVRPPAPRRPHRPGASTGATAGGSAAPAGSGRELCWFPDPIGARGLLPRRAARCAAARAGLPRRRPRHRAALGHPPRPVLGPPPDAAQAAPGGAGGRRPGGGARACATAPPTRWCSAPSTGRRSPPAPPPRWPCGGRSAAGCPSGAGGLGRGRRPRRLPRRARRPWASRRPSSRAAADPGPRT